MPSIPQRLYNQIMMLDNFTCVYCGKRTPDVQVDHIIPRNYDGPDTLHNLVAACPGCNAKKRDHQLHEVGMRLRFGRFTLPTKRGARIPVGIVETQSPVRPHLSPEERLARIDEFAVLKDEFGEYTFSANKIVKMVGGNESKVKARVAALRPAYPRPIRKRNSA